MKRQDLGMSQKCWDSLWGSVRKWSRPSNFEEMFTFCIEVYFLRAKNIEQDADSYYSVLFRNACIDFLRKQYRRSKFEVLLLDVDEPIDKSDHNECVDNADLSIMLSNFLRTLNEADETIAKALLNDVPYEELRETLDIPMNTLKTRVHRRREKWHNHSQLQGLLNTA